MCPVSHPWLSQYGFLSNHRGLFFSAGAKTICGPSRRNVPKRYYHKMVMALADVAYNLDMLRTPAKMLPSSAITTA